MNRRDIFPRALQYLIAIAEHGSFTRAAEALHVSQPSLSQQIKLLEEALQTSLLDRTGRQVSLTFAGEIYLYHARRAWRELDEGSRAVSDIDNLDRGLIRLGWTPITDQLTCCLLDQFNTRYPRIQLSTIEMPHDEILAALADGRIDVGIAFTRSIALNSKVHDVEMHTLFDEELGVTVGNDHPLAGKVDCITPKEFEDESLVLLNPAFFLRRVVDGYCFENDIEPSIAVETNSLSVVIDMIQVGSRATILPSSIASDRCGLNWIDLKPALPRIAISMVTRTAGYSSAACSAFTEIAKGWALRRAARVPSRGQRYCPLLEVGVERAHS